MPRLFVLYSLNISILSPSHVSNSVRTQDKTQTKSSMEKFLKDCDSRIGFPALNEDVEKYRRYLDFCYFLKKPRKLTNAIRSGLGDEKCHQAIIGIFEMALKERRLSVIEKIERISEKENSLSSLIDIVRLRLDIEGRFSSYKPRVEQIERVTRMLNGQARFSDEQQKNILNDLFLRLQKMYRAKEWRTIATLLENSNITDRNFHCCKFYPLSLSKLGDEEGFRKIVEEISKEIRDPENIEDLVDMMYTENLNNQVINLCDANESTLTFRTNLIYARSLKKIGLISESDRILEQSKKGIHSMIESSDVDIPGVTKSIMDIGYSGDIQSSERLLFELTKREGLSSELIDNGLVNKFVELVNDTLDRQKRIRLSDSLSTSRRLMSSGEHAIAYRLLEPFIEHGIENSAELFEQYTKAAIISGNDLAVEEMISKMSKRINKSTAERLVEALDQIGQYRIHSSFIRDLTSEFLDSKKIIRSFFKVRLRYSGGMSPREYLRRISSLKDGGRNTDFFIEALCRQESPKREVLAILIASRGKDLEKLSSILHVSSKLNSRSDIRETILKIDNLRNLDLEDSKTLIFLEKAVNTAFNIGEFERVISLVNRTGEYGSKSKQMAAAKFRSLVALGELEAAEDFLRNSDGVFSKLQILRFNLDLGNKDSVKNEVQSVDFRTLEKPEKKRVAEILFRLNMHVEYTEIFREYVKEGDFNLSELTRYFHSLCKLGEDHRMVREYEEIQRFFSWKPMSRAIIAVVGYDFLLTDDFVEEIEIAVSMDPKNSEIPIFVCKSFYSLERVDIAYYFLSKYIHLMQNSGELSDISRSIGSALRVFEINPSSIRKEGLVTTPIYSDVEVIRKLVKNHSNSSRISKSENIGRIGIQSHTMDIGGAERQVSLLLNLLSKGKVNSSSFSLITNIIPKKADYSETYYPDMEDIGLEIFEYSKPPSFYGDWEIDNSETIELLEHVTQIKKKRIQSLASIYRNGDFDIAHTWQDWCNIYGGVAAVIAGVNRIIMSGRTLPPVMKSRLQARSGRSYREAYKILLSCDNIEMIHNSRSGLRKYSDWLGMEESDFSVIHNGLNLANFSRVKKLGARIRKELDISRESTVIGYVGRFSSDKQPWVFLAMAESVLSDRGKPRSEELYEWVTQNGTEYGISSFESSAGMGEFNFIMVGDGPQIEKARRIVDNSKALNGKVHIVGYSSEIRDYLSSFDCLVLTSRVEGLPNVIIEAQFSGLPVLTTNAGGAVECIIEGETGILSETDSPEILAEKLLRMLEDEKFMRSASKKSKKFAKSEFSLDSMAKRIGKLYEGI